jgi:hypothetical protein
MQTEQEDIPDFHELQIGRTDRTDRTGSRSASLTQKTTSLEKKRNVNKLDFYFVKGKCKFYLFGT